MIENDTTAYQLQNSREFVGRLRSARVPTTPSAKLLESAEAGGMMNLDLLAIAAHPDDVELTCGGTLLKMAQRGYKTGILDLSAGEMGTRGTPEIRANEAAKAAKFLAVNWRGTLGVPDSDVQPTRQHKLRLAALIRQLPPKSLILPYWEARDPVPYHAPTLRHQQTFPPRPQHLPTQTHSHHPPP